MALSNDEKELANSVMEEVEDFYAPYVALCLYRFQAETKLSRQVPTEMIQKIAVQAWNDLNEHSNAEQEGS
jgi:hypothetical protein